MATKPRSDGEFVPLVVEALKPAAAGLRSEQVLRRCQTVRSGTTASEVSRALRSLHEAGEVRLARGRRWQLLRRPPLATGYPPLGGDGSKPAGSEESGSVPLDLAAVRAAVHTRQLEPGTAEADTGARAPEGFERLRQLAPHYAECLQLEERRDVQIFVDRAVERVVLLDPDRTWWPARDRDVELRLPLSELSVGVRNALSRRRDDELMLGYPLQLVQAGTTAFLRPLVLFAASWELERGVVAVRVPAQAPELNGAWLAHQRRRRDTARRLEAWLDLQGPADDDTGQMSELGFEDLVDGLRLFAARELHGDLDPSLRLRRLSGSVPAGVHNTVALFLRDDVRFAHGAIADLRELSGWSDERCRDTALAPFFAPDTRAGSEPDARVLEPLQLGEDQLAAARDALSQPLTVVTGPPGTGKSQAAAAVMASALVQGRPVLLASRNHKALDAVELRLLELSPDRALLARVSRQQGGEAFDLRKALDATLARVADAGQRERLGREARRLGELDRERDDANRGLLRIEALAEELRSLEQSPEELEGHLGPEGAAWAARARPGEPQLSAASRLEHWPVIGRWLRRRREWREIRNLSGAGAPDWQSLGWPEPSPETRGRCLELLRQAARYAALLRSRAGIEQRLRDSPDREGLLGTVIETGADIRKAAAQLLRDLVPQALDAVSTEDHARLRELREALALGKMRPGDSTRTDDTWARHGDAVLRCFPLWAVTNLSARRRIPMVPALFDLVIIDEASQCDIASALPLLARARRAMVIGDPNQLRHVTTMPPVREGEMLARRGLLSSGMAGHSFTQNSLFDLADQRPGARRHLLRDHFRSHEAIADFVSATFYGGRLHGLTPERSLRPPPGTRPGLHWTDVRGAVHVARSGCHAPDELEAILEHLEDVLVRQGYEGSVGVVTPFAEQARRLSDAIARRLPAARIEATDLVASTAHQFQGDARDLILLSPCLGPGTPSGSRHFLKENPHLINVAVSRARAVCHIFGNLEAARESGITHIVALARASTDPRRREAEGRPFESPWEERLYHALRACGLEPIPQYPIAGRRLDLALVRGEVRLDVEVDGDRYHRDVDGRLRSADLWRDHQLRSLGWRVLRFWVYELREDMDGCVERILDTLRGDDTR